LIEPELRELIVDALPPERLRDEDRTASEVVDILASEIERNFELLASLPDDPPSQGDIEAWFQKGVVSSQRFFELYDQHGGQIDKFGQYYQEASIDQGWEGIQRAHTLDRIGTNARPAASWPVLTVTVSWRVDWVRLRGARRSRRVT
jgi:hypothetical protein